MHLKALYAQPEPTISFELFPPKTPAGDVALFRHVETLVTFAPAFFTCTYGAGGSTRDKTLSIVTRIREAYYLPVAAHLTCVGATVDQLRQFLVEAQARNIEFIVALRGDPPKGEDRFIPVPGGLRYANELVALIRAEFPGFGIAVAGYPEVHQEAPSAEADLANLQRKVDAGAEVVLTQLFYRNEDFLAFWQRYERAGIKVPLVPGILPVTNLGQIQRITQLCGARLPDDFVSRLGQADDPQWQLEVGVEQATHQVRQLLEAGVPGIHFYVLNQSTAASRVLCNLNLR
jgi:methylenetetrahydrofolate reductase (NADPH)